MIDKSIRDQIDGFRATLDRLDGQLSGKKAKGLPDLLLAKLALDLDAAGRKLEAHAEKISRSASLFNGEE
jgi:hypothetical protein